MPRPRPHRWTQRPRRPVRELPAAAAVPVVLAGWAVLYGLEGTVLGGTSLNRASSVVLWAVGMLAGAALTLHLTRPVLIASPPRPADPPPSVRQDDAPAVGPHPTAEGRQGALPWAELSEDAERPGARQPPDPG